MRAPSPPTHGPARRTTLALAALALTGCTLLVDDILAGKPGAGGAGGATMTASGSSSTNSSSSSSSSSSSTSTSSSSSSSSTSSSSGCTAIVPADCSCPGNCVLPNATTACSGSTCVLVACLAAFGDCDHDRADGCETNLKTNDLNCGACGNACVAPKTCKAGTCK